jgi:chromatin segregation and condensation protein Rec8/ScpA/Scc1 (kleisin family)
MAILEMLRTNQIEVEQDQPFGELTLVRIVAA